jgi:hypothetical protein
MISLIKVLINLIDEKYRSPDDKGAYITLREKNQSKCKPFKLRKGRTKTVTIEVDQEGCDVHPLLREGVKNLKKRPDYIIFCENTHINNNIIYILVVELKSDNSDDWHRQAKAGVAIAQYLVGMLENYQKMSFPNIEYRCLLFHTKKETAGIAKKSNLSKKSFEYEEHKIFKYKFTDKPCNISKPYELEMFLR